MSKPPTPPPLAQTISGAFMPGTSPSRVDRWRPRILWALAIVFGVLAVDKAISDAGAAEQARSDTASSEAAAETRRTQDASRELVRRSE